MTPQNSPDSRSDANTSILCRIVRRFSDRSGDGDLRGGWMARHRESCPECASYFARVAQLDHDLTAEARAVAENADTPVPAGLEDRIWQAVQAETGIGRRAPATTPSRARHGAGAGLSGLWRGLGLAAGIAAIALVAWQGVRTSGDQVVVTEETIHEADLQALAMSIEQLSSRLVAAKATPAETATAPAGQMTQELEALGRDGQAAWDFLRANFMPSQRALDPAEEAS